MGKLRILGSGTSTGVPEIGCTCPVCTSTDPRDNRLRASSLLHTDDAVILIDCGPDFREQMLRASSFEKIDGVLVTHEHYDHVGGLDDLRPFGRFADKVYPGVPRIYLQEVEAGQVFHINRTEVLPLRVMHGRLPILGYRIGGRLGYITDMHMMPEESYEQLKGLDVLVMNALRPKPHPTLQSISEALEAAGRIGAKETYFIHMSHHAGLHADIEKRLPPHVHFAYDGLEIDF